MEQLYTGAQCRELDRVAIDGLGLAGFELMRRAGRAAFDVLLERWPRVRTLSICCGKGNNAGDGYIIAGLARQLGLAVDVWQEGDAARLGGDAGLARDWAVGLGVTPRRFSVGESRFRDGVIVDALLGTGLEGPPRAPYAEFIDAINAAGLPVLAVDVPSGVNADNGAAQTAVRADVTVTFIGRKLGLHTGAGVACAGDVVFADLGVGAEVRRRVSGVDWLRWPELLERYPLPRRDANAYKQSLGHVVVVGGDRSMGGAPLMAGEAALRSGAGMVTVVTRAEHRNAILARRPELMVVDAADAAQRDAVLGKATVIVVGPGLGRDDWGRALLTAALDVGTPAVVDADGLNGIAALGLVPGGETVITPHVGEAALLLGTDTGAVQADRVDSVRRLAQRTGGVAVLKGAGTLIAAQTSDGPALLGVCAHGNPGMATAGMGDVLSGIVGGLWAQRLDARAAAVLGVCLHSRAADLAAEQTGQRGLLATDLLPALLALTAR